MKKKWILDYTTMPCCMYIPISKNKVQVHYWIMYVKSMDTTRYLHFDEVIEVNSDSFVLKNAGLILFSEILEVARKKLR